MRVGRAWRSGAPAAERAKRHPGGRQREAGEQHARAGRRPCAAAARPVAVTCGAALGLAGLGHLVEVLIELLLELLLVRLVVLRRRGGVVGSSRPGCRLFRSLGRRCRRRAAPPRAPGRSPPAAHRRGLGRRGGLAGAAVPPPVLTSSGGTSSGASDGSTSSGASEGAVAPPPALGMSATGISGACPPPFWAISGSGAYITPETRIAKRMSLRIKPGFTTPGPTLHLGKIVRVTRTS